MQRFVPVGRHRIHVVGGLIHDEDDAKRTAATIAALEPESVVLVTDVATFRDDAVDGVQDTWLRHLGGNAVRNALWKEAKAAARSAGAELAVLHQAAEPAPRRGLKQLEKLLRKEGFERTGDPHRDVLRLHEHYLARCPDLVAWTLQQRRGAAARLRAAVEARPKRVVAVIGHPDADGICDAVQDLA